MRELKKDPSNPASGEQRVKRWEVRVRPISGESDKDSVLCEQWRDHWKTF